MPATDWITADAATLATGVDMSAAELEAALPDITDLMRWTPIFGIDLVRGTRERDRQADAFGRAIAWQAAYRQTIDPEDVLTPRTIAKEAFGTSYSVEYEKGNGAPPIVAKRVRTILVSAGLLHMAGVSRPPLPQMDLNRVGVFGTDEDSYGAEGPIIPVIP